MLSLKWWKRWESLKIISLPTILDMCLMALWQSSRRGLVCLLVWSEFLKLQLIFHYDTWAFVPSIPLPSHAEPILLKKHTPSPSFSDLVLLRSLYSLFLWMGTIQLRTYESCFVLQTNYSQVLSVHQHPSSLISSHQHRPICPKLHVDLKEDIHSWVLKSHLKKHLSSLLAQFSIAMNPACTKQSSLWSSAWLKRHVSP